MASLFKEKINLHLKNADICYYPNFLETTEANLLFRHLKETIPWQQDTITLFGKSHPQPRLTALFSNNSKSYTYSNITMQPYVFTSELSSLKQKIDTISKVNFTSCLLNLYRDGRDSNGWHADDEPELGKNPIIASISLGHERFFHLRKKMDKQIKTKLLLEHGSLLLMKGETQHFWQHQIPKTTKKVNERINLTYRIIR